MLKDITLGQYFPGNTVVPRLDPRTKLILVIVYIVALFSASWFLTYGIVLATLIAVVCASKIQPKVLVKNLKPLLFIIILTGILNLFYTQGTPVGEILDLYHHKRRRLQRVFHGSSYFHANLRYLYADLHHFAHCADRRPGISA